MNGPRLAFELRLRRAPFHRPFCFLSRLLVRFAGITSGHFPTPSWMKGPGPRLADGSRVIAWKVPGSSQRVLTNDRSQTKNLFARSRFPSISICVRAESGSMPFVKTRQANSCGIFTREANSPTDRLAKFHRVDPLDTETIARRIRRKSPPEVLFRQAHRHLDRRAAVPARNSQGLGDTDPGS
jgi:hypothetical protein